MKNVTDVVRPLIEGYSALLEADADLLAIFASVPHVRRRGSVQAIKTVPGIYYSVFDQIPRENFWSALVQWDVWAKSYDLAVQISDRIGAVMHGGQLARTVNGILHFSSLESRGELPDPDDNGARIVNLYRYHPIKEA